MARVKKEDKYAKNPFMQQALVHTVTGTRMIYGSPTGDDTFAAVNMTTGENLGDLQFGKRLKVDKTNFLKFYADGVRMFLGLSKDFNQEKIELSYDLLEPEIQEHISRATFFRGIKELKEVNFLAPTLFDGIYWINVDYVFKGDRLTLVNQYILEGTEEIDPANGYEKISQKA